MDTFSHVFWAWFFARKNKLAWLAAVGAFIPDLAGIASGAVAVIAAGFDLRVAVQYFHLAPYAPYYLFFHSVLIFAAVACV
ncbi:hypothetical protein H0O03_03625, partial [Candidatus Micrarchaeota archaeon]|nr:hypothetical protein [Candidatus Micrarchaeota archaeon]